jgi:hypothetical protein
LANAHFLAEQSTAKDVAGHLQAAEFNYRKALVFEPNYENAKRNLEVVYRKAQQEGRLRVLPTSANKSGPGDLPFTGYEVGPAKK